MPAHYENFPVASWLLPSRIRVPILTIYQFARTADDYADEGNATPTERLQQLQALKTELDQIKMKKSPRSLLGQSLAQVIQEHQLPLSPFYDLLRAFAQDIYKTRYANFEEVLAYCQYSANPIGLLLLHLFQATTVQQIQWSNAICSSLQLINFYQDIEVDLAKDRVYLAQDELFAHGLKEVNVESFAKHRSQWRVFFRQQIDRAEKLLWSGLPLIASLKGRPRLEIACIAAGGLRICQKLRHTEGAIFGRRPTLNGLDRLILLGHATVLAYLSPLPFPNR